MIGRIFQMFSWKVSNLVAWYLLVKGYFVLHKSFICEIWTEFKSSHSFYKSEIQGKVFNSSNLMIRYHYGFPWHTTKYINQ